MVHPRKDDGSPDFAGAVPCRFCTKPEQLAKLLNISSLEATFSNFKPLPGTESALRAAKALAGLKTTWKLLLLYGPFGNGKTHLVEGIAIELFNKGIWVPVMLFPALMGRLKATFDLDKRTGGDTFEQLIKKWCTTPYLLLDDVGAAGSYTDFSFAQLERIILERYRASLFTVITTNRDLTELPGSVRDRFEDAVKARMVQNKGKSFRPEKKK